MATPRPFAYQGGMEILYKCRCMAAEVSLTVPDRQPATEILEWMELVTHAIAVDHKGRNAMCMATEMEYAKIPVPEGSPSIGVKPKLN